MKLSGLITAIGMTALLASGQALAAAIKAGLPLARDVRAACSKEAKAQGLKGGDARAARSACFAKQRPDLAAKAACRRDAKAKGLGKDETNAMVKACSRLI